jgi:hypothetical protein
MSETDYDHIDAILSVRRTDDAPTTTMDIPTPKLPFDYFPETPSALTGDLFSPSTITRLAVLAGGISTRVRGKARQIIPQADIPSLLRDLRYTLIELHRTPIRNLDRAQRSSTSGFTQTLIH